MASSSSHGGVEEYVVPMKKVLSKDLKSGRLIGKGLSSMVYETTWEGKSYARKDFLRVPSDIFEKEAAAVVGFNHPNVVRTYCWAVDERSCSLVLELMGDDLLNMIRKRKHSLLKKSPGSGSASQTSHLIDLHKFIEDGRNAPTGTTSESAAAAPLVYPFNLKEALQIILQVAEGMMFLHDKGVVHGDLKPKNILAPASGRVASSSLDENLAFKVADFGLVGTKMKSRSLVPRQARKLEMVRWRAPELLNFREDEEYESSTKWDWDPDSSAGTISVNVQDMSGEDMKRADVYNFALTCSQILTGEDPCPDLDLNDLVRQLSLERTVLVRPKLPPTCPAQLSNLLKLCWGESTERPSFQDILSVLKDLQASLARTGSVVDSQKNTITGASSARIDSPELELIPENSAVSGQPSERPGGSLDVSPGLEIDQTVDVPSELERLLNKDIEDSSKGTHVLNRGSRKRKHEKRRKASSHLGYISLSSEEMEDIATPSNPSEEIWPGERPGDDPVEGERQDEHPEHVEISNYTSTGLLPPQKPAFIPRKSSSTLPLKSFFTLPRKLIFNHPVRIFLSYAGGVRDEKNIISYLFHELTSTWRYKFNLYKVFFDRQSLPHGIPIAKTILEELEKTQLGIVLVSEDYFRRKWPMLELLAFVDSYNKNPTGVRILPLFYKLRPPEVSTMLEQGYWDGDWMRMSTGSHPLNVSDCRSAVETLKNFTGIVYIYRDRSHVLEYMDEILKELMHMIDTM